MQGNYRKLLIEEKGRIFLDVAYSGCGSGCKYCYVPSASQRQVLASYEDLGQALEYLNTRCQNREWILSFCPNTEPFKTKESIDRVLFVLRGLKGGNVHVQISTKEYVSDTLLYQLNGLAGTGAIFINVSIPFLDGREREPGAASIEKRISNMERIGPYPNLKCGLYLKPCCPKTMADVEKYIAIIHRTQPDYICIGLAFDKKEDTPCATLHREKDAAMVISAQKDSIIKFAEKIRAAVKCPVVYSSICAVFQAGCGPCSLGLWHYDGNLCSGCNVFHGADG